MYKRCTIPKAISRQRQLQLCLLFHLQQHPLSEITVSSLCRDTGLPRRTFYSLFDSKEDVLCALIDQTLLEYADYQPSEQRDEGGLPKELIRFFSFWQEQRLLLDALNKNQCSAMLTDRIISHIAQEEYNILRIFGADGQENSDDILLFCLSGIMGLVINWHRTNHQKTVTQMSAIMYQQLTTSLVCFYNQEQKL